MKKLFCFFILYFFSVSLFAEINHVVFFGDSLSDNGNLYRLLKIPKSPPYYFGRFSNGPTWADNVASYYEAMNVGTENYAVGGATVILRDPFQGNVPWNFSEEINSYLLHSVVTKKTDINKTLFIIWLGANDYLDEKKQDPEALTTAVVNETVDQIKWLMTWGASHFYILNLPDISKSPHGSRPKNDPARLHLLSQLHNLKLEQALNKLKKNHPAIQLTREDINFIFSDLLTHLDSYNETYHQTLKNVKNPCWKGGINPTIGYEQNNSTVSLNTALEVGNAYYQGVVPCEHPEEYIFWDSLHPSEAIHYILGEVVKKHLTEIN